MAFKNYGSNSGFALKGLQLFIPISPDKQLIFFDSEIYSIGNRSQSIIQITHPKDVYQINTLQICSAAQNIYFKYSEMDVKALHRKAKPFLRQNNANLNVLHEDKTKGLNQELIRTSREDIKSNLKISFVKLTKVFSPTYEWFKMP